MAAIQRMMDGIQGFRGSIGRSSAQNGQLIFIILLILWMVINFSLAGWYSYTHGQYRSTPPSISTLQTIMQQKLQTILDPLNNNTNRNNKINSVCDFIRKNTPPYNGIDKDHIAMVNFRPLTVRLAGYLGGINSALNGVFNMDIGIKLAIDQGARAFIFEIDYFETNPCKPVVIFRDSKGYMRSLHSGSIEHGCTALKNYAFIHNTDPVLVILYLRRVPTGTNQLRAFLKTIAQELKPLKDNHLGNTYAGNYYNCGGEDRLFRAPIIYFENNFIVITNYDTSTITPTEPPTDSLNYWTHARIWLDPKGIAASLGTVTKSLPSSVTTAYAQVGAASQLLNIPSTDTGYVDTTANIFTIAMPDVDYSYSTMEISTLINTQGIQCAPLDVLTLAALPEHEKTIGDTTEVSLKHLSNATNSNDPLSFWKYAGWSRKHITADLEGFQNMIPVAAPIPGFVIPKPIVPKKPHPSMNSNGGLVSIA